MWGAVPGTAGHLAALLASRRCQLVDLSPKSQLSKMPLNVVRCPLSHIFTSWVLLLAWRGAWAATLVANSRWPRREGNRRVHGGPGPCLLCLSPSLLLPLLHIQARPAKFPAPLPLPGPRLSVSCSLRSWLALGEGQIFTAPWLTQDRTGAQRPGVSLSDPGHSLVSIQEPGWGQGVSELLLSLFSRRLPVSF